MSATMVTRIATPITRAAFSTTSKGYKPVHIESPASADAIKSSSWAWRNLSPQTRKYVVYGVGIGLMLDGFVVYNYYSPSWFGGANKQ